MRGLVLGGGASKGSWQAGAIEALEDHGYTWDYIVGVSVGALNGAMLAINSDPELIWKNLQTDSVYKKFGKVKIAWRILRGYDSVYSTEPLRELLTKHLLGKVVSTPFTFVTTDMTSGQLVKVTWDVGQTINRIDLDYLRASASMPILFDPVVSGTSKLVDGGVRQINPMGTALENDPDELIVVLCGPTGMTEKEVKGVMDFAGRTVDIFLNEIFNSDLHQFLTINSLVVQANEEGCVLMNKDRTRILKHFDCMIVLPENDLGDGMDFSANLMRTRYEQGYYDTWMLKQRKEWNTD